jgi:hypothetical protein
MVSAYIIEYLKKMREKEKQEEDKRPILEIEQEPLLPYKPKEEEKKGVEISLI